MLPLKFKRYFLDFSSFLFILLFNLSSSQKKQTVVQTLTNGTSTAAAIINKKCQEYSIHRYPKKADGSPNSVCPTQPGIDFDYAISNSNDAQPGDFPHMALIGLEYPSGIVWRCGGSLISEYFVLTAAAHCHERAKFVRIGTIGTRDKRGWSVNDTYKIAQLIPHPNYVQGKSFDNIMLIKLAKKVEFSYYVSPVCLYTSPKIDEKFRYGVQSGFAGNDFNQDCLFITQSATSYYYTVRKERLEFVDIHKCDNLTYTLSLALWKDNITWNVPDVQLNPDNMICLQEDAHATFWLYNHGNPLQIQPDECTWSQVGIHSINHQFPAQHHIFTKVSPYIDWIQSVVWPQG